LYKSDTIALADPGFRQKPRESLELAKQMRLIGEPAGIDEIDGSHGGPVVQKRQSVLKSSDSAERFRVDANSFQKAPFEGPAGYPEQRFQTSNRYSSASPADRAHRLLDWIFLNGSWVEPSQQGCFEPLCAIQWRGGFGNPLHVTS
jgi:hypothetical protein